MKKHILVICLLLSVVLSFSSCKGKGYDFAEVSDAFAYEAEYEILTSKEKVDDLNKLSVYSKSFYSNSNFNELVLMVDRTADRDEAELSVYNLLDNRIVLTVSLEKFYSHSFFECGGKTFVMITTRTEVKLTDEYIYSTSLYNASGTKLLTKNAEYDKDDVQIACDLLQFGGKIYRVGEDAALTLVCDAALYGNLSTLSLDCKTSDYYYAAKSESVSVYDHNLDRVYFWELSYDADLCLINPLAGGKVLVQYINTLPEDAKSYDLIVDGDFLDIDAEGKQKCELVSLLLDVEKDKEKELKLDYIVAKVMNTDEIDEDGKVYDLPDKIDNLAAVMYIEDDYLVTAESEIKTVVLNSKGKVASDFIGDVEDVMDIPYGVAPDRFLYSTESGDKILADSTGKSFGKINSFYYNEYRNESYIVISDRIYDWSLNLVYDLDEKGLSVDSNLAHGFILVDEKGEYSLFTDGNTTSISGEIGGSNKQLYTVIDTDNYSYSLYNESIASFTTGDLYDHHDAEGFINLFGLSCKVRAMKMQEQGIELL